MAVRPFADVELGDEIPREEPDIGMERVREFAGAVGMTAARFTDHEGAKKQGLPGAIVPGIMSQALLASAIHRWAPGCEIRKIDTIFRAPIVVDSTATLQGVVTDTHPDDRSVDLDLTIENEAGETRVIGTALVRLGE